ncbi:protein of unknown function [Paracoccus isoporae]|uniref:DUF2382 domain-containing protein n=1 Tax=Paracoccus isoporae TaxID=591205 RepID=A0A1G7BJU3_9RHOB|nr:YsnF/AvaK domain-containing protein [Paracoccus isoporae]SDE27391.1 protein of unknown function [Paracoccus isoporae]
MADFDDKASTGHRIPADDDARETMEVAEETARIVKRVVDRGGVRLDSVTEHRDELLSAELRQGHVEIRRIPRDEVVEEAPAIREEDGVTIIPVLEERAVLRTELVLVEEVHLVRTETRETVEVPVTLRRQRLIETELEAEDPPPGADPLDDTDIMKRK